MDRLLNLKKIVGSQKLDLKTPTDTLDSPMEHSTAIRPKPDSARQRTFFPSLTDDSPTESKSFAELLPNMINMSSMMKDLSMVRFIRFHVLEFDPYFK